MPPRVWVLTGEKAGDNAQCRTLAEAVGWPYEEKRLRYNALHRLANPLLGASRLSLVAAGSDPLAPPWPDLVIASGRRSVPLVRWLRARSGGRAKLVQIGRPRANLALFDLVVTTPQYRLPERENVVHLGLPPHRLDPKALAAAAETWRATVGALPAPRVALLVGGSAKPFRLDPDTATRLAAEASRFASGAGGSLLVTTSRRTPPDSAQALRRAIAAPAHVHLFGDGPNPYLAYLALADAFVVTGDSASMLAEAIATGRPVYVFELPVAPPRTLRERVKRWLRDALLEPAERARREGRSAGALARFCAALPERGLVRFPRDLSRLHRSLYARGLARPLGERFEGPPRPPGDELARVAARIRALVEDAGPRG